MCILALHKTRHIDLWEARSIKVIPAVPLIRRKEARIGARAMTSQSPITTRITIDRHRAQGNKRASECWTRVWSRVKPYVFLQTKRWPMHSTMLHLHKTAATSVVCRLQNLNKRGPARDTPRMLRKGTKTWPVSFLKTCSRPCQMLSNSEINHITLKMYLHHFARTQAGRSENASDRVKARQPSHHPIKCWVPNRKRKSTLKT